MTRRWLWQEDHQIARKEEQAVVEMTSCHGLQVHLQLFSCLLGTAAAQPSQLEV